ncbi:MAG: tRNA (adenosine(37)-N6)-threonylcarbamoyltransferase complex dimerization subunit type 1 TsaB, partial [Nitrospinota bacterium]|nr:tRNA (adenosine(37)-N6)-threonylcarbamoyltransferase complex dimerization subunit type 1 TsaB [Nitrospinota bacterium]
MLILGMDGSLASPGVALVENGRILATRSAGASGKPSRDILTMLTGALDELSVTINDIGLICVTQGPGSFTGVRAAMATAQGL